MSPVSRWQRRAAPTWIRFDDGPDWVVYNPDSADIHLVSDSIHRLWILLGSIQPTGQEQLASALAVALDRPALDVAAATAEALTFMDQAGLIEPASS